LIGFAGASTAGNPSLAVVAKQGPSPSDAQASLARQEAIAQQIAEQWEKNRAGMAQTTKMQMGPSMQLMQSQIAALEDIGAHNR
jgi:hypothetical protein